MAVVGGTLSSVLAAIDARKAQDTSQRQQQALQTEADVEKEQQRIAAWKIVSKGEQSANQGDILSLLQASRCEDLPIRFFSDPSTFGPYVQGKHLRAKLHEPAVSLPDAISDHSFLAKRSVVLFEFHQMLQDLSSYHLCEFVRRAELFLNAMEKEYSVKSMRCEIPGIINSSLRSPCSISFNGSELFVADEGNARVLMLDVHSGKWSVIVSDNGVRTSGASPSFGIPCGLAWDEAQTLFISDTRNNSIWAYDIPSRQYTVMRDGFLSPPQYLAYDRIHQILYFTIGHAVQCLHADGTLAPVCGDEFTPGFCDGNFTEALLKTPRGLAVAVEVQCLLVADYGNNAIRRVALPSLDVTTLAGTGEAGFLDGKGAGTRLAGPSGLSYDGMYTVYFADSNNHAIRKLHLVTGMVVTIAGSGLAGKNDRFGPMAQFDTPTDLFWCGDGVVYVADKRNEFVRLLIPPKRAAPEGGVSLATCCYRGFMYIADAFNHRVEVLDMHTNVITTLAGSGLEGFTDGPLAEAQFAEPRGLAVDGKGILYVADYGNHRIRRIDTLQMGVVTVAGTGVPGCADGDAATASLDSPHSLTYDEASNSLIFACADAVRQLNLTTRTVTTTVRLGRRPLPSVLLV